MKDLIITNNQLVCQFCNNDCIKSVQDWWNCDGCSVSFNIGENIIQFSHPSTNNWYSEHYTVHISLNEKKSSLFLYHTRDGYTLITSFDKVLDITPQTFPKKLKTYLLFL
jgi:hypothetical protein